MKLEDFLLVTKEMQKSNFSNDIQSVLSELERLPEKLEQVTQGLNDKFLHNIGPKKQSLFLYNVESTSNLCSIALGVYETVESCTNRHSFAGHPLQNELRIMLSSCSQITALASENLLVKPEESEPIFVSFDSFISTCQIKFQSLIKARKAEDETLGSIHSVVIQVLKTINLSSIISELEKIAAAANKQISSYIMFPCTDIIFVNGLLF